MDTSGNSEDHLQKKGRHRKKQLYNSILQQMEFYFSDSNLAKDRFMNQQLNGGKYIDLEVFLKFNKIRKLTLSVDDLVKAIKKSDLLELSDDKSQVCRKTPVVMKENADDCTIYVENVKSDATHEWLKSVFLEFGNIAYVSIPRYKNNNLNKGFAFVEFEDEDSAKKTIEFFDDIGCKMSSQIVPDQLISIMTFEEPKEPNSSNDANVNDMNDVDKNDDVGAERKRKRDDLIITQEDTCDKSEEVDIKSDNKRKKMDNTNGNEEILVVPKDADDIEQNLDTSTELEKETCNNTDTEGKKKKKRIQKRKAYFKELGLQILSKKEWKKMRNKYLNKQREKMKALKAHLNKKRFAISADKMQEQTLEAAPEVTNKKSFEYQQGVIVKLILSEPAFELKSLKTKIKTSAEGIQYVDATSGSSDVFIRFSNNEAASNYLNNEIDGEKSLLEGNAEHEYWEKIKQDLELKTNKEKKKQRGRTKLLKRAERELGKHIWFDDTEL